MAGVKYTISEYTTRAERHQQESREVDLERLRQQVRAHLAAMDETPAPPYAPESAAIANERLWRRIERNPPTGRRQKIQGREQDTHIERAPRDVAPKPERVRRKLPTLAEELAQQQQEAERQRIAALPQPTAQHAGCLEYQRATRERRAADFLHAARHHHGDRYDYSRMQYVNAHTKIVIVCPVHGEYEQEPQHHRNGHGCPTCGHEKFLVAGMSTRFPPGVLQLNSYNAPRA